ncbi:SIR2-like domain-containing protein [Malonomonas rubra DSM 5091]|uniref:SIR2-like domain-containing protein n=1 Tax=Malonomonas rubra DSM 5091 TaxID=1122189 RepID=A0A1M6L656_MALRU|nr:SIR2 family protein [Malonomonas rubra]SHJ66584.1 SIR2-like domain-containing protein [Malonomonas rubra DSM 5091]
MNKSLASDRIIPLGPGLPAIPERLLLAHARGEVLFIAGAGISRPTLPDFRDLVLQVYSILDQAVHAVISIIPSNAPDCYQPDLSTLNEGQSAEVRRFVQKDYDVVLGLLERRIDNDPHAKSKVRQAVRTLLLTKGSKPSPVHRSLMRLSDRGGAVAIATTNFDLLLEKASRNQGQKVETYTLGGIPRPGRREDFSGVLHIHGALDSDPSRNVDLILTDQDFGEFYLRRRVVPDFIYDVARLYHIVLVGYSANDPPMRYLLNAVAADGKRFDDLKERFTFIGGSVPPDSVEMADWKGRGITPIPYDDSNGHKALADALEVWAKFSAINGKQVNIAAAIKRIIRKKPSAVPDNERDLVEHFIRRGSQAERERITNLISDQKPHVDWLTVIEAVLKEKRKGARK